MTTETINKLDAIIGKTFYYKGKNITIDKYKEVNSTNTVVFAPHPMNFLNHEIPEFLDNLFEPTNKPLTAAQVLVPQKKLIVFEPTAENKAIKETLLETLQKVKDDPNYIKQAKAVCEVVNSFVEIQKNEIQMLGIINKYK
ncbi:hypothetical protein ACSV4D_09385 [Flavobacterium sp. ARAG 55.4]|uniref:hypothetical protein n=1 Tax=Flavobacterium sp. ARAG 55.4 TaxID=3451357 RepID=UPI003F46D16B